MVTQHIFLKRCLKRLNKKKKGRATYSLLWCVSCPLFLNSLCIFICSAYQMMQHLLGELLYCVKNEAEWKGMLGFAKYGLFLANSPSTSAFVIGCLKKVASSSPLAQRNSQTCHNRTLLGTQEWRLMLQRVTWAILRASPSLGTEAVAAPEHLGIEKLYRGFRGSFHSSFCIWW